MRRIIYVLMLMSCMLLSAIPANAADFTLGIFGNANMDDTIDEDDVAYVEGIIKGSNEKTELADANYDGEIDEDDITQIELIIQDREEELTILDSTDRIITINMPVESIAGLHTSPCREFCKLEVEDKVAGACIQYVKKSLDMYPGLTDKTDIGTIYEPNYETIAEVRPDVLIMSKQELYLDPVVETVEPMGIKVIALDLQPLEGDEGYYDQELIQLGYIIDKEERAMEFCNWKQGIFDLIEDRTEDLTEEEKVSVFGSNVKFPLRGETELESGGMYSRILGRSGCKDSVAEIPGSTETIKVSGEWVIEQEPDVIVFSSYYAEEGFGYLVTDENAAKETLEQVLIDPIISETKAAKEGNIFLYSYYGLSSGGETPLGALYLAKHTYSELFEDVDPAEYHRQYFEDWFDVEYKGVWFYP